jgi:phosphoenolpyruvate-protein phosphotransferase
MTRIAFAFPLADGLHARPASLLQEACLRFDAAVVFRNQRNRRRADAASVLELVGSSTVAGDPCLLEVSGAQEQEAASSLREFLRRRLPHADDALPPADVPSHAAGWLPPLFHEGRSRPLLGRVLASGQGCGRVLRLERARALPTRFAAGRKEAKLERRLFQEALVKAQEEWRRLAAAPGSAVGSAILKAQLAILSDPKFHGAIDRLISKRKLSAGVAISRTAASLAGELQRSPSAYLRERAGDIREIAARLGELVYGGAADAAVPALLRASVHKGQRPYGPLVVVADSLSPAGLLGLDRRRLRGLVLAEVGFTSHVAILARSLAVPAVSLAPALLAGIVTGEELIVDGRRGLAVAGPDAALKRYYRLEQEAVAVRRQRQAGALRRPAQTKDGVRVEIAANVGSAAELEPAWSGGAEAIGLFRSEILFLDRETPPDEDEQYAVYSRAARTAKGRPVIIRTVDAGGDKHIPYLGLPAEANPFLGYRAVRFYGEHEELIRCQLRAILRAACHGRLQVMVPMVTAAEEVRLVRRLLAEAVAGLRQRQVPHAARLDVGIMVETPAAALSLDLLARQADFFSVGSNDLLQYFLAVDRGNARLESLYDPLHPAFLRLLQQAAMQARRCQRRLGLCGEMAGSSELLPLLVGIGFDELSMAAGRIAAVRERLAQLDGGECRALLGRALRCADAGEVAALLREFNSQRTVAGVTGAGLVRLDSASRTAAEAVKEICDLLEFDGRLDDASTLEEAVWKREQTFATDLGLGFALPHGKSGAVRTASVAFLRPRRPIRWSGRKGPPVRGVLLIAIPDSPGGGEHLKLIARLSRRLMHEDFRAALLSARNTAAALRELRSCLDEGKKPGG